MINDIRELHDAELDAIAGGSGNGVVDANGKSITALVNAITFVALVGEANAPRNGNGNSRSNTAGLPW